MILGSARLRVVLSCQCAGTVTFDSLLLRTKKDNADEDVISSQRGWQSRGKVSQHMPPQIGM